MDHPFRSAALGGFNKQDVLSFLEEQSKQSAQAQQLLQSRLEEAEGQRDTIQREGEDLRRQLEEVRRELAGVQQERDSLSARLAKTELDLSAGRAQAGQMAQELEKVRRERDEVQARLDAVQPDAQAYVELKERTAGVELEAHRRAQAIQEKAEQDARQLRRQLEQWLRRVRGGYDALCSDVESTVAHAASELGRASGSLDQLLQLMGGQDDAFDSLNRICDETTFGRPEPPMPIDET